MSENGVSSLFSRQTLAHATAGSLGSIIAMALTYPLDRVRTQKQLHEGKDKSSVVQALKKILKEEGWIGLYKGLQPMLVALGASNFVYFYWFTALRVGMQFLARSKRFKGGSISSLGKGAMGNLVLASIAGTINVFCTTPLWVAYTRLVVQGPPKPGVPNQFKGVIDALLKIPSQDGLGALWSGLGPSLILVSNPSVQFASYESLKRSLLRFKLGAMEPPFKDHAHFVDVMKDKTTNVESEAIVGPELSSVEYLILGAVAKMIATVVTYPLQVAQTRLRAQANAAKSSSGKDSKPTQRSGTIDCLMSIYESEGLQGLYRGMEAKLLQTCLNSAFMFTAYEAISAFILRLILWRKFSPKEAVK
mmetsp:Transcript_11348/g.20986  ORF Transcript_11348/g.20986 Transcript_11348/m.20986 type:complete len:362 (-) Transcript_11348:32-1117(-)